MYYQIQPEPIVFPDMVTVKEAAKASGLAVYRVRQLYKEGKVKYIACGKRILIQLQSLRDYLEKGDTPPDTDHLQNGIRRVS